MRKLQNFLIKNNIEAIVVTEPANIRYWSGFSGSNGTLVVAKDSVTIITDFRYEEQVKQELICKARVQIATDGMDKTLWSCLSGFERIAFEGDYLSAGQFLKYQSDFPDKTFLLLNIDAMRIVKSPAELLNLKKAADIANRAFDSLLGEIKVGMTEIEVAASLEYKARTLGAAKMSFDTIIASGMHSAMPHAHPTNKIISKGDFVVMDFGVLYNGYCSDMTRTIVMGKASSEQKSIYNIVLDAQVSALNIVKNGVMASKVDELARSIITKAGYGKMFGHSTGHGVGLHIHEQPRLSSVSTERLKTGMVVTVEPGIYIPNMGGVRIEDLVIVTKDGRDVLTADITKELLEI